MILGEEPGWVSLKEAGDIFGLTLGQMHNLRIRHVYSAVKMDNNVWAVRIDDLAEIADRINVYQAKLPYHADRAVTIEEAAGCLGVSKNMVYQLRQQGDLEWAQDELRRFVTRDSLEALMWSRGLGRPKLTRVI